jgi:single-stranded-DNA-specific exonuclease
MQKRWSVKAKPNDTAIQKLSTELNIDPILAALLLQRGIHDFEDARSFFRPETHQLHDPFLMKDMEKAILRIEQAFADGEKIMVYGDYDVDGTTSVAVVYSFFKKYYPDLDYYIPDRYKEGYGISTAGIDFAKEHGFSLIIALDCGIKSVDKIVYANALGIDFIICETGRLRVSF